MDTTGLEVFSLEDDDYNGLFITQTPREDKNLVGESEKCDEKCSENSFLGVAESDFQSPCVSLFGPNTSNGMEYSDISDAENEFDGGVQDVTEMHVTEKQTKSGTSKNVSVGCGVSRILGLNLRRNVGLKRPLGIPKTVSNVRQFKKVTASRLDDLKKRHLKKKTFSKMQWGVRAYNDWRNQRLMDKSSFDAKLLEADLTNVPNLSKENLVHALCMFIPEVTKLKDGSDYPGKTLYEMVTSIQKYLHQNNKFWKLLDDCEFRDVRTVLDNVMKERAEQNIGLVKKQANYIPHDIENSLWEQGKLGEHSPDILRSTVLFLLGLNLGLRAVEEHYDLRRDSSDKPSQLSFERSSTGQCCLVYREDTVTKTNDSGLKNLKKERKVIWVFPSENLTRCPVRIVDKYISFLPQVGPKTKKLNFYLRSLEKPNPAQWYGEQVVGKHALSKVISEMLKDHGGFFTNHSLHRSGTTRLFQAGVERKIVKEYTGHVSDAIDKYQITSEKEKEQLSKIIRGAEVHGNVQNMKESENSEFEVTVKSNNSSTDDQMECVCKRSNFDVKRSDEIGSMINAILENRKGQKTKIRLEIEFGD